MTQALRVLRVGQLCGCEKKVPDSRWRLKYTVDYSDSTVVLCGICGRMVPSWIVYEFAPKEILEERQARLEKAIQDLLRLFTEVQEAEKDVAELE